jgi:hypothetical protein
VIKKETAIPKNANTMDILKDWAILEADFRREYSIDLVHARLSWRAFLVLANGLSPNSIWTMTYQGRNKGEIAIEDDDLGERAVDKLF